MQIISKVVSCCKYAGKLESFTAMGLDFEKTSPGILRGSNPIIDALAFEVELH